MNKNLIIMVGVPGSGKSTIVNQLLTTRRYEVGDDRPVTVLSTDDYIEAVAQSQGKTYSDVFFTTIKDAEQHLYSMLDRAIQNDHHIIWDQTNLSTKKRKMIMEKVPSTYRRRAYVMVVDKETIVDRLYHRNNTGKVIPQTVIDSMFKQFEMPSVIEGFDCIRYINGDGRAIEEDEIPIAVEV